MTDAPIWVLVGQSFSAVFPPGFAPDWDLVRQVRLEFHPEFVPLFMVREYQPPDGGSRMKFEYLVIGRWTPVIDEDQEGREPLKVERPSRIDANFPFEGGYIYDQRTWSYRWPSGSHGAQRNIPEIPRPFDKRTVEWMREAHHSLLRNDEDFKKRWKKRQDEIAKQERRELEKLEDDARRKLYDDAEASKAIKEGTLDTPYEVEISAEHVYAEKVMEGTEVGEESDGG